MRKRLLVLMVAAMSVAFVISSVCATSAPDKIVMNNKVFKKHKKALVHFTHKKHHEQYKVACTECHHVMKDGKNVWKDGDPVQKCTECHKGAKAKGKMPKAEKIKGFYYNAIHANCVGCHKDMKKKGKKAPSACKDCHPKKK
ncbi:MAG: cytochrome c3 family protein [Deltaproteobacteria bacterium]|nr:cytochrome c3 family protein [Deltaproteobacteria bacterium]